METVPPFHAHHLLQGSLYLQFQRISCLPSCSDVAWSEPRQWQVLTVSSSHKYPIRPSKKQALLKHPSNQACSRAFTKHILHVIQIADGVSGCCLEKPQTTNWFLKKLHFGTTLSLNTSNTKLNIHQCWMSTHHLYLPLSWSYQI